MIKDFLWRKTGEEVDMEIGIDVQGFQRAVKLYFKTSKQLVEMAEWDLDVDLGLDYDPNKLLEAILRELKKNNSSLFI